MRQYFSTIASEVDLGHHQIVPIDVDDVVGYFRPFDGQRLDDSRQPSRARLHFSLFSPEQQHLDHRSNDYHSDVAPGVFEDDVHARGRRCWTNPLLRVGVFFLVLASF